jgi:TolA-binding protein
MKREQHSGDAELDALLERGRNIPPAPDVARARAMARARATVAAAMASAPAQEIPARGRGLRVAVAASVALVIGAAGATAALLGRTPRQPAPPLASTPRVVQPVPASAPDHLVPPPAVTAEARSIAKPQRSARPATAQESYAAELDLLQRAQSAYTSRDFSDALVLVAEHGRRFPNGRLAEQREALRVKSLVGSGRADEARHAVAAFAKRFPRSALLQRLQATASAAD